MNARFLMMNHFSSRYPKVPIFDHDDKSIGFAFDLMSISFSDFEVIPALLPVFRCLFKEEEPEEETELLTIKENSKSKKNDI